MFIVSPFHDRIIEREALTGYEVRSCKAFATKPEAELFIFHRAITRRNTAVGRLERAERRLAKCRERFGEKEK